MAKIHEVAQAAGVSISTVSYALSGKRPVSAATRARIEAAAQALDYAPNAGARMLAGRRTHILALTEPLRPDTHAPTHMAFVLASSIAARRNDYDVLLLTDEQASAGMRRVATSGLADGIIVLDVAPDDERVELARRIDLPTAFVGVPDDSEGLMCVDLDFERAAGDAVDKLVTAGHQVIGLVGHAPSAYQLSNFPPRVRDGYSAAAQAAGVRAEFRMLEGEGDVQTLARRAAGELLDAGATGILLHCHDTAHAAVLSEVHDRGLEVPQDVSIISVGSTFDTGAFATPLSAYPLVPKLSCDLAVELLVQSLSGEPPEPGVRLIAPTYLDNGSVATPRAAR
ncbi:LacI family transcriptional regulator [Microbacterium sp. CFH 90308]|uniref:LacI family transcriptional regulator n=1 Tax=Microbacterium salsuginis TaxID=2722803 RepID=A0ABX1KAU1_9MICO|nr:LacI family DNA-binding transcriptional regulator [Microbacterium sp. CFH 90308]NLP83108.1 LacI family transcriptional regulator [Microbacterium sp. CFH 90308]